MNKAPIFGLIILLFVGCRTEELDSFDDPPPLYSPPKIVPLNTGEGYTINPVWGDTIQPSINSYGDTLVTGVPIPAKGKAIHANKVSEPEVILSGEPVMVPYVQNVHMIPDFQTIIPVNMDSLIPYTHDTDTPAFVLLNTTGDTVPTGEPVMVKGKVVDRIYPQPIIALQPRIKENANINMSYLDVEQGMSMSYALSVFEDSRGNIWIGTDALGVSMYNGTSFTHFSMKEGLSGGYVFSILEDRSGNLWFGTWGGVTMYDGHTFTNYTEKEGLSSKYVRCGLEDSNGNLWFGTKGGGVCMYNGETFTHFTQKEGLSSNSVRAMLEDKHGNLWFGTYGEGVCMYDGKNFRHLTQKEGLSNSKITSMLEDSQGNLWFGTDGGGVCMFNGDSFTHYTEKEGLSDNRVWSMLEDSRGNLWFGTWDGGVCMYNGNIMPADQASFTHFTDMEGLRSNIVHSILEDSSGNLWFGTFGGGVSIYKSQAFMHFTQADGLSHNKVFSILEDSHGNFWFGTEGGGVTRYNGETFTHYTEQVGLCNDFVYAIVEDSLNNLWFGTWDGVNKFDGRTFTHYTKKNGLYADTVSSILEDSHGNLWFGSEGGGLFMYNGETFTQYTEQEGFSNSTLKIIEDSHGNLWFIGSVGLSMYDGVSITHFTEKEGLSKNGFFSLMEDSHNNLWFGSNLGGISIYNGEVFTHFTETEGLCNNTIYSIVEDRNNNIWVSTEMGISLIEFGPESAFPLVHSFGIQDGLKGMDFYHNSVLLDSENRIWWGSGKGLTMLDLNTFQISETIPRVRLEWLGINGSFVDFRQSNSVSGKEISMSGVERFYNYPLGLKVPSRLNHLTFNFSAIDWSAPHKLKYSYKMEGMEETWSQPSSETSVDYRNLPPGKFTFIICAIGESQIWSDPFEYSFTVLPPWYRTLLAQIIYILLLSSLIYVFIRYRTQRLRREKIKLEGIVAERTAELRRKNQQIVEMEQLKTRFFTNVSHEIRTPLSLISGPLDNLLKEEYPNPKTGNWLAMIKRSSQRLLQLVNQLLDISRLDSGRMRMVLEESDVIKQLRRLAGQYQSLAETRKIKYVMDIPDRELVSWFDREKLEKIITNLLSNAFKFTPKQGIVTCRVKILDERMTGVENRLRIMVADTGPGIPGSEREKIFERFYRAEGNLYEDAGGTGIGLSLTKELIGLMHGELTLKSLEGAGAVFIVTIPLGKEHLKEEEYILKEPEKRPPDEQADTIPDDRSPDEKVDKTKTREIELLIVEDNEDLRTFIRENLSETYKISEAEDGLKGLNMAHEHIPDLIISDVMMPEMDGMELCRKLKGDERTSHIPVIMLTAKSTHKDKMEGLELGADEYLFKPFNIEELTIRIRNLLEQRERLRKKYANMIGLDWSELSVTTLDEEFLKKITATVTEHMHEFEFDVMSLQDKMAMSRGNLHRKLKALTGETPSSLIRVMRVKAAASMIEKGVVSITEISMNVGFSNPSHFAQCFKKQFGVSPRQYRSKF